jgi:DNA polymerase III subunit alpha
VVYLHPKLEPILARTYGVAIYQEQVMQIARALAGFSPGDADVLRKAMGKKIPALLAEQKEKFIDGCVKNGIYKELAEKVFSFIEPFAGYGFNRSHAACYAMIGYQTAYLKAHWPVEFMAALLSADQHDSDRVAIEIEECRAMGLKVMPPDINESFDSFTVVTAGTKENKTAAADEKVDTIRFGLNAIKNVGDNIVSVIIKERKENGPYQNIFELLERINDKDLNKKSLESLIKSGALESLGSRGLLLANLEKLLIFNRDISKQQASGQVSLFASAPEFNSLSRPQLLAEENISQIELLGWEKDLLGLYISGNPLSSFSAQLDGFVVPLSKLKSKKGDDYIVVAGVITSMKKIITRKGESMLFVKIEDKTANVELLVFPRTLKETPEIWQDANIVIARGRLSEKDTELKLLIDQAGVLEPERAQESLDEFKRKILDSRQNFKWRKQNNYSSVSNDVQPKPKVDEVKDKKIKAVLEKEPALRIAFKLAPSVEQQTVLKSLEINYPGDKAVYLRIPEGAQDHLIKTSLRVNNSKELRVFLRSEFQDEAQVVEPDEEIISSS